MGTRRPLVSWQCLPVLTPLASTGFGIYVEMALDEALTFIRKRHDALERRSQMYTKRSGSTGTLSAAHRPDIGGPPTDVHVSRRLAV